MVFIHKAFWHYVTEVGSKGAIAYANGEHDWDSDKDFLKKARGRDLRDMWLALPDAERQERMTAHADPAYDMITKLRKRKPETGVCDGRELRYKLPTGQLAVLVARYAEKRKPPVSENPASKAPDNDSSPDMCKLAKTRNAAAKSAFNAVLSGMTEEAVAAARPLLVAATDVVFAASRQLSLPYAELTVLGAHVGGILQAVDGEASRRRIQSESALVEQDAALCADAAKCAAAYAEAHAAIGEYCRKTKTPHPDEPIRAGPETFPVAIRGCRAATKLTDTPTERTAEVIVRTPAEGTMEKAGELHVEETFDAPADNSAEKAVEKIAAPESVEASVAQETVVTPAQEEPGERALENVVDTEIAAPESVEASVAQETVVTPAQEEPGERALENVVDTEIAAPESVEASVAQETVVTPAQEKLVDTEEHSVEIMEIVETAASSTVKSMKKIKAKNTSTKDTKRPKKTACGKRSSGLIQGSPHSPEVAFNGGVAERVLKRSRRGPRCLVE